MGGSNSKNVTLTTPQLLKRIDECALPEETDAVLDLFEIIEAKLKNRLLYKQTTAEFRDNTGLPILVRILKKLIKNELAVTVCINVLEAQTRNIALLMDFIQLSGIDLLKNVVKSHEGNEFLTLIVPKLLKSIVIVGAAVAIREIRQEALSLQLCRHCQETVERDRCKGTSSTEMKLPFTYERMNRVLSFMESYADRPDVLIVALDAALLFANNADGPKNINQTNLIEIVCNAVELNQSNPSVLWRGALLLSIISSYKAEIAGIITKIGTHEILAKNYDEFIKEPRVQQQILWFFNSVLMYPRIKKRIQQSEVCVNLFVTITERRSELIKKAINVKYKYGAYEVVIPLTIRTFLRETNAMLEPQDQVVIKNTKEVPPRRNFNEHPRYGTTKEMFSPGESGLVDDDREEIERPWESKLQYGESNATKKKREAVTISVKDSSSSSSRKVVPQ